MNRTTQTSDDSIQVEYRKYRNYSVILYEQNYPDFLDLFDFRNLDLFDSYPSAIHQESTLLMNSGTLQEL